MNQLRYLFLIALFSSFSAAGQYASSRTLFQVNEIRGCNPLEVQLNVLSDLGDGIGCQPFVVDWNGDGTLEASANPNCQLTHTYNTTGKFLLKVYLGGIGSNNIDDIEITVVDNIAPTFEISACNNYKVLVTVKDRNYDQYMIDFDNQMPIEATLNTGASVKAEFSYNSVNPTPPTIAVRGKDYNSAFNCAATLQTFVPVNNLNPAQISSLEITSGNSINLTYTPAQFVSYRIDIGTNGTNYQNFGLRTAQLPGATTESVENLNTDNNYYCFQFQTFSPCDNIETPTGSICSVNLKLGIDYDVNKLTWTTNNAGIADFSIERNTTVVDVVSGVLDAYDDTNITCATDYCYKLTANYSNGSKSISALRCGTSITALEPLPIENIASVAEENAVALTWYKDPASTPKNYFVFKKENQNGFSSIATIPEYIFTDNNYNTAQNYTYRIDFQDVCNLYSPPGTNFSPILLKGILKDDNTIELTWNNYRGYRFGISKYVVDKFDVNGNILRSKTFNPPDTTWLDEFKESYNDTIQGAAYRVTAIPKENIGVSISNPVYLERNARLIFPTAFTPNDDNLNDAFTVSGQFVKSIKLQIFNRWGELLFSTDNNESWDGTHEGIRMPESVYVWKATVTDLLGRQVTKTGSVALLHPKL